MVEFGWFWFLSNVVFRDERLEKHRAMMRKRRGEEEVDPELGLMCWYWELWYENCDIWSILIWFG